MQDPTDFAGKMANCNCSLVMTHRDSDYVKRSNQNVDANHYPIVVMLWKRICGTSGVIGIEIDSSNWLLIDSM